MQGENLDLTWRRHRVESPAGGEAEPAKPMMERARVIYRGTVQGVGFRFTTRRLAGRFPVAGYVRNLPEGTVELVAEGERPEVEAFLGSVLEAMGGYIAASDVEWLGGAGDLVGFEIRF